MSTVIDVRTTTGATWGAKFSKAVDDASGIAGDTAPDSYPLGYGPLDDQVVVRLTYDDTNDPFTTRSGTSTGSVTATQALTGNIIALDNAITMRSNVRLEIESGVEIQLVQTSSTNVDIIDLNSGAHNFSVVGVDVGTDNGSYEAIAAGRCVFNIDTENLAGDQDKHGIEMTKCSNFLIEGIHFKQARGQQNIAKISNHSCITPYAVSAAGTPRTQAYNNINIFGVFRNLSVENAPSGYGMFQFSGVDQCYFGNLWQDGGTLHRNEPDRGGTKTNWGTTNCTIENIYCQHGNALVSIAPADCDARIENNTFRGLYCYNMQNAVRSNRENTAKYPADGGATNNTFDGGCFYGEGTVGGVNQWTNGDGAQSQGGTAADSAFNNPSLKAVDLNAKIDVTVNDFSNIGESGSWNSGSGGATDSTVACDATIAQAAGVHVTPPTDTPLLESHASNFVKTGTSIALSGLSTGQGNLLVMAVAVRASSGSASVSTIVDDAGNGWSRIGTSVNASGNSWTELWYSWGADSIDSITVTLAAAATAVIELMEFGNILSTADPLDSHAQANGHSASVATASLTSTNDTDLVVGVASGIANLSPATLTSSGWTGLTDAVSTGGSDSALLAAYTTTDTATAQEADWTSAAGTPYYGSVIASFKASSQNAPSGSDAAEQTVAFSHNLIGDKHATSDVLTQTVMMAQRLETDDFVLAGGTPWPVFRHHRGRGW